MQKNTLSQYANMAWAFSVQTENINQKILLVWMASQSEEFGYFDYRTSVLSFCEGVIGVNSTELIQDVLGRLLHMNNHDITFAYRGLIRLGLVCECPSKNDNHQLCLENKIGAKL